MRARIQKWGNSLAVRIPKALAAISGLVQDSEVEMLLENDQIILKPIIPQKYSLSELLAGITRENTHSEIDTGAPVGKESW